MARPKRDLVKISMNFPVGFLELLDAYAETHGISRTTAVIFLCSQAIKQQDTL